MTWDSTWILLLAGFNTYSMIPVWRFSVVQGGGPGPPGMIIPVRVAGLQPRCESQFWDLLLSYFLVTLCILRLMLSWLFIYILKLIYIYIYISLISIEQNHVVAACFWENWYDTLQRVMTRAHGDISTTSISDVKIAQEINSHATGSEHSYGTSPFLIGKSTLNGPLSMSRTVTVVTSGYLQ